MNFWTLFFEQQQALHSALLVVVLTALLFALLLPVQRRSLRLAWGALLLCALALGAGHLFDSGSLGAQVAQRSALMLLGLGTIQVLAVWVFRGLLPGLNMPTPRIAQDLSSTGLSIAWGLVWLKLMGVEPNQLFTTSALITGALVFAMQDTLGNVLGGVTLQLDNSLSVGDWVRIDELQGQVMDVRWRYTSIRTRQGELVIIPNSALMKNRFAVLRAHHATPRAWRRNLVFKIDPDIPPSRVIATLEHAARDAAIANVLREPAPSAVLMEVSAAAHHYTLRYWLDDPARDDPTDSDVRQHALAALARHSIRLALPREERLNLHAPTDWHSTSTQRDEQRRLAAIQQTELFAHLPSPEQHALARHLIHAPFVAGDTITRQGAVAHWLYLIIEGEAQVLIDAPQGRVPMGTLHGGNFFGEMGMLTGEPRQATVLALTDVDCYRLDKAGFAEVIQARPEVALEISAIVDARHAQLNATPPLPGQDPHAKDDLLSRIREFFALGS